MTDFDDKWNKAKFLWFVDLNKEIIQKVKNEHYREVYEDMVYRHKYFFTLKEAKRKVNKISQIRTADGHCNTFNPDNFKIIKNLK